MCKSGTPDCAIRHAGHDDRFGHRRDDGMAALAAHPGPKDRTARTTWQHAQHGSVVDVAPFHATLCGIDQRVHGPLEQSSCAEGPGAEASPV